MNLKNNKILIIGGSSGIGLGIAKECTEHDAQVMIASRSQEKLERAAAEVGSKTSYHSVDISSKASITQLFKSVGNIDHLVITSGFVTAKTFENLSDEEARQDFEINFWGKFNTSKIAATYINSGGSITFISGAFAKKPNPNVFMTSISVSAVETMAKTLAISLSPIRVNVISPYVVDTSLVGSGQKSESRQDYLTSTAQNLPTKCIGSPKDIGEAAVFLMNSAYSTGSTLALDGGFTIT